MQVDNQNVKISKFYGVLDKLIRPFGWLVVCTVDINRYEVVKYELMKQKDYAHL